MLHNIVIVLNFACIILYELKRENIIKREWLLSGEERIKRANYEEIERELRYKVYK